MNGSFYEIKLNDLKRRCAFNNTIEKIKELQANNRWQELIDYLKPIVEFGDRRVEHLSALGFAYSQLNKYHEARYCYKQWLELEPNKAQPYYCIGYTFYDNQEWKEAIEWFDQALEIFPDYLVCLYRKGVAQYNQLKSRKAKDTLSKAIKVYQQNNDEWYIRTQAKYFFKAIFYLGKAYYDLEQFNNALACFKKIAEEDQRDYIDPIFKKYNLAKGFFGLQRYPEAIELLQSLIKGKEAREYVYDLLARVQYAQGKNDEAFRSYFRALQERPASYIFLHRGQMNDALDQVADAERDYHQALKRDKKGKHKILLALGKLALRQKHMSEAKSYILRAIEFKKKIYDADYADAHLALAEYFHLTGQEDLSKAEYARASELIKEWV